MWRDQSGRSEVSLSVRLSVVGKVLITDNITTSPYLPLIHTNSLPGPKLARSTRVRDRCTLYVASQHTHSSRCAWCARGTCTRRRTPPARLATARGSAPPSPAARTPATCAAMGAGGERQPRHWAARMCQSGALAAPRTAAADGSPRRPRGTLERAQRAIQRRRPARLRPTAPRRCGSCAAALGRRRRSPARWSAHARAATACKWSRSLNVVRTPEPHSERAMGAALTRPTGTASALARTHACGV